MIDVNTAFDAERGALIAERTEAQARFDARVASGELKDLGGGRYQQMTGWDAGEIWANRSGILVPQHGLDMTTGKAALYSAKPEWHGLGSIIPGGTTDVARVLELGGINWLAEKRPVHYYFTPGDLDPDEDLAEAGRLAEYLRTMPGKFVNVRTDTGDPLGIVGARYTNVQNHEGFAFLQELAESSDLIWESAGALRGGRKVFISTRLPDNLVIDAGGIADGIEPHIVFTNSFDGTSPVTGLATPWRPRCGNTERLASEQAWSRWTVRHTAGALERVEEARRNLGLSLRYYEHFTEEETLLARTAVTMRESERLLEGFFPAPEDPSDLQKRKQAERMETLHERLSTEAKAVGLSAYAVERTVTGYLDNDKPRRTGESHLAHLLRATANLEGNDDDTKNKAHKRLLAVARG